jgi:hypothetical protein
MRRLAIAGFAVAPLLVLLLVWLPVWRHYWVPDAEFAPSLIAKLRRDPVDSRMLELERQAQDLRATIADAEVVRQAIAIREGRIELPTGEVRQVTLPFDARDFDAGTPGGTLSMASLIVPDTLLRAYEITGDEAYFVQARQALVGFAEFERGLLTDIGNVRNDHAIVARMGVLIHFWRLYRKRTDFDEVVARQTLQQAARCAAFLGRASHFTAATNHGVMQNIGLLQAAAAFPDFPGVESWKEIASTRLRRQMAFYVSEEGVVLENAPGYHRFGTALIGMVLKLLEWNGLPDIDGLATKYARAVQFLDRLRRPDGSIPRIGDTSGLATSPGVGPTYGKPGQARDLSLLLPDSTRVYPVSGYAITERSLAGHDGKASDISHATAYWSYFPGHGHEVASEGSFLLWAAGTDWLTNTGYWTYGLPGREDATGWRGSNAPHLRDEAATSVRVAALLAFGADGQSHLLDLARSSQGGSRLRRQFLQIDEKTWFVLDSISTPQAVTVDRLWTFSPALVVEAGAGEVLTARDAVTGRELQVNFVGQKPPLVRTLRASLHPFGGWVVNGPQPTPASSYEVSQQAGSLWVGALFTLLAADRELEPGPIMDYSAEDDWSLTINRGETSAVRVRRTKGNLMIEGGSTSRRNIVLASPPAESLAERDKIQAALASTLHQFRRFHPYLFYRERLSYVLVLAALISIAVSCWSGSARRLRTPAFALGLLLWAAAGAWIQWVYLAG